MIASNLPVDGFERSLFKPRVGDSGAGRVLAGLAHRRRRKIDAGQLSHVRGEQQFGIADPAAQAEHARFTACACLREHAPHHVRPQGTNGRPREMLLRESGVQLLVVLEFPFQNLIRRRAIHDEDP